MNRNEEFPAAPLSRIDLKLSWAALDLIRAEVDTVQLLISGSEADIADVKCTAADGSLTVEQPKYNLSYRIASDHWMQVVVRLPMDWKGEITAATTTATLSARGLTGSDLQLSTVTGALHAADLEALTLCLRSVSGAVCASRLRGESLTARNVSGELELYDCSFRTYHLKQVSGESALVLRTPFESFEASTVSGDLALTLPMAQADVSFRTVKGRLQTAGIDIADGAPGLHASSVTGDLALTAAVMEN